ncbi:MAG: hypothetical protein R3B84_01325 [Zavarzinella sp.]
MKPIDTVLDGLNEVQTTDNKNWKACCPAHNDYTPGLSIKETDDGKVLLHCHAGCEVKEIVAAMGLKPNFI